MERKQWRSELDAFMFWRGWTGSKPGKKPDQNQDAYETRLSPDATGAGMLLALCDGATSTLYAGPWARALAASAELDWPNLDDAGLTARLDEAREQFQPVQPDDDLPWNVKSKFARHGSQSTLLAVAFAPMPDPGEVGFHAVAVGDSTLIVFRCDGSVESFPLSMSGQFGLSPKLISTKPQPSLQYERWDASVKPGDVAVACTDAVGKWILEGVESADQASVFGLLLDLMHESDHQEPDDRSARNDLFRRIANATTQRRLCEDDVTLVLCVPTPRFHPGTPRDFALAALKSHQSGDFSGLFQPSQPWWRAWGVTVLNQLRRVFWPA